MLGILTPSLALAEPGFGNDAFKAKWQRADKPVNDATFNPARSWLWGPESFLPPGGATSEQYANSPGGNRQALYFDKARMEINNPASPLVTNGLLVRELITGKLATGDASNIDRQPAFDIPVAGDPANNNGPTYASFQNLVTFNPGENAAPNKAGQPVIDYINKDGTVSQNPALGSVKYAYYNEDLKHNIPDVLWIFMNQRGNVYVNGQLVNDQPVLGDNPLAPWLDATGFPISDAYWANVTLAGKDTLVLIQNFERRTLTYTPSNPVGFQVEMGNVGRHYYTWRYDKKYDAPVVQPAQEVKSCQDLPKSTVGVITNCGPAGMRFLVGGKMDASENLIITPIDPDGNKLSPLSAKTSGTGDYNFLLDSQIDFKPGKWTYQIQGAKSGKTDLAYIWLDPPTDKPTIVYYTKAGKAGDTYYFSMVGFAPKEEIVLYVRDPEGYRGKTRGYNETNIWGAWFVIFGPSTFDTPGVYKLTFQAKNAQERYINLEITIER
jgi:hypothetical protein